MSFVVLLLIVVLVGFVVWLIYKAPIHAAFKTAALVIGVLVVLGYALEAFGLLDLLLGVKVPRVHK